LPLKHHAKYAKLNKNEFKIVTHKSYHERGNGL